MLILCPALCPPHVNPFVSIVDPMPLASLWQCLCVAFFTLVTVLFEPFLPQF